MLIWTNEYSRMEDGERRGTAHDIHILLNIGMKCCRIETKIAHQWRRDLLIWCQGCSSIRKK